MQAILTALDIAQADLVRETAMSKAAAWRLANLGEWPKRHRAEIRARVAAYLRSRGATPAHLRELFATDLVAEAPVAPAANTPTDNPTEDTTMLLRNATLTADARQAFGLTRNPFVDEIQTRGDVFASRDIRYVRNVLLDAALNNGFVAIVGESGSGKSTLAEELEQRIADEQRPVRLIRPYILAMEDSDAKGKPMKSTQIGEAIMRTLAPTTQIKSSPEARFEQIHNTLKASRQAGYSHLLVIEEAHCLPKATLKHLKRFTELKQGLSRLLGVALIGQPELRVKLSDQNPDVREVVQRCELVELPPLDNELEAYIQHKLSRAGAEASAIFEPDAYDAIRARLIRMPRGGRPSDAVSVCYPLVVNNLVTRAMNAAASVGMAKVDASVIAGC